MLDAAKIYASLGPELETLDKERRRLRRKLYPINLFFFLLLTGSIGITYWLLYNGQDDTLDWFVPTFGTIDFVALILWSFGRYYFKEKFKKLFIAEIVPKIVSNLGEDFTYQYDQSISVSEVRESLLFPYFNKFESEDLIRGSIDHTTLKFAEIRLVEEKSKSEGSGSNYTTIFKGVYFNSGVSVTFPTSIWIVTNDFDDNLKKSNIPQLLIENNPIPRYKYFGEDQEMAQQVLRPFVLEKIDALNKRLKKEGITRKPLLYKFSRNRVQMAMETSHGLFDPKISQKINSLEFIQKQTAILNAIVGLLGELTLR